MSKSKKTANINKPGEHPRGEPPSEVEHRSKELEDQLKRALADYQNLERRVSEERQLLSQLSASLLIEKLLPVLDNLENAQMHLNDQGLEIVIKQFKDILNQEGVTEIEAVGTTFDPNLHEAIDTTEGENENMIVKVARKGYKLNDKVLRPAQVVVERKAVNKNQTDQKEVNYSSSEPE